jgi:hypothetical protein
MFMAAKTNQSWTLYKTNSSQDESNMNSLQNKWLSRRIKHEISTKQIAVVWFLLTAISFVESSWLIRLDCRLFCREFMLDSCWLPFLLKRVHVWFVLTAISFVESSCLIRWTLYKKMAVKTNQTWTVYKTNGSQGESNMNSLQNKWQSRRIKHELSTKEMTVKTNQTWFLLTAICFVEFTFDSSWLSFLL